MTYSQAFLDKHRDINTDHDWWDYIEEMWKEQLYERGVQMGKLYFTGFWSQGDGACFEGSIPCVASFIRAHQLHETYPLLAQATARTWIMSWEQRGRYCHENSLSFDTSGVADFDEALGHVYDIEQLEDSGVTVFAEQFDKEVSDFHEHASEVIREYCRDIYRSLEEEYDYQTSDEAVTETLEANDILEEDDEA